MGSLQKLHFCYQCSNTGSWKYPGGNLAPPAPISVLPRSKVAQSVYLLGGNDQIGLLHLGSELLSRHLWGVTPKCKYEAKRNSPTCFRMQPNRGGCLLRCYTGYLRFFTPFWCKWTFFALKNSGFHAPPVLKTLLHGRKVPKLASRDLARANSQVGAPSRKVARANSGVGAPSPDLARANDQVGTRHLRTWRAPRVPPPIQPSTCTLLLSLEIPSLTCPCTLGTKKALFNLLLWNGQKIV